jgi:hypothetical protein
MTRALFSKQTVAIYRNRRSGQFRIQPYARIGAGSQPFGEQTVLQQDVSDEVLLRAVQENLEKNDRQSYNLSMAPCYPAEERRRILKEDQLLHVQRSEGDYKLIPLKKMRNSFGSIDNMTQAVGSEEFHKRGAEMIRQLFEQIVQMPKAT